MEVESIIWLYGVQGEKKYLFCFGAEELVGEKIYLSDLECSLPRSFLDQKKSFFLYEGVAFFVLKNKSFWNQGSLSLYMKMHSSLYKAKALLGRVKMFAFLFLVFCFSSVSWAEESLENIHRSFMRGEIKQASRWIRQWHAKNLSFTKKSCALHLEIDLSLCKKSFIRRNFAQMKLDCQPSKFTGMPCKKERVAQFFAKMGTTLFLEAYVAQKEFPEKASVRKQFLEERFPGNRMVQENLK